MHSKTYIKYNKYYIYQKKIKYNLIQININIPMTTNQISNSEISSDSNPQYIFSFLNKTAARIRTPNIYFPSLIRPN